MGFEPTTPRSTTSVQMPFFTVFVMGCCSRVAPEPAGGAAGRLVGTRHRTRPDWALAGSWPGPTRPAFLLVPVGFTLPWPGGRVFWPGFSTRRFLGLSVGFAAGVPDKPIWA